MTVGKWGQPTFKNPYVCVRCAFSTANPACLSCGKHLCEPCFQFTDACCNNQLYDDSARPTLKRVDSKVPSTCLMLSIMCNNDKCLRTTAISTLQYPISNTRSYKYCPVCGTEATVVPYNRDRQWAHLAKGLGLPVAMVREVYSMWNKERTLRSFIRSLLEPNH